MGWLQLTSTSRTASSPLPDLSQLAIRLAGGLQITGSDAQELLKRLQPVLVVENLDQIGDGSDKAVQWCWRGGTKTGVAARFSGIGLVNPAGSGTRILLEAFMGDVNQSPSSLLHMGKGATVAGTLSQGRFRDASTGQPVGQIETIDTAGITVDDIDWRPIGVALLWTPLEVVIDPGENVRIQTTIPEALMRISYFWKEFKLPAVA